MKIELYKNEINVGVLEVNDGEDVQNLIDVLSEYYDLLYFFTSGKASEVGFSEHTDIWESVDYTYVFDTDTWHDPNSFYFTFASDDI